jgi:receptor protein-tyrosine kinase
VANPLELPNLPEGEDSLNGLPELVIIIDSASVFAADANRVHFDGGSSWFASAPTIDSVTRALQSMSHNNVLGVVANGAKRGELYSKYTYYHSYYYEDDEGNKKETGGEEDTEE